MSKPATQNSTAPPKHQRRPGHLAADRHPGRQRGQHQRRAQPEMGQHREPLGSNCSRTGRPAPAPTHRAAGGFRGRNSSVPATKPSEQTTVNSGHARHAQQPGGKCRLRVRGFSASSRRSARRLKAIAALRAKTMQTRMPSSPASERARAGRCAVGRTTPSPPPTAQTAAQTACG